MVDFFKAMSEYGAGVDYNRDLSKFFAEHETRTGVTNIDISKIPSDILESAKTYSDVAIVVIKRWSAESEADRSFSELELSDGEKSILKYCGENFKKTIVLLNNSNPVLLGPVNTIPGIKSVLISGFTGTRGAYGIPPLLFGDASPSGHLADTYVYDFKSNPNYWYVGNQNSGRYLNSDPSYSDDSKGNPTEAYNDYVEGIYVGYKWYETADTMGVWDNVENEYGKGYNAVVQYPFGFGLSYTNFEWSVYKMTLKENGEEITGNKITDKTEISLQIKVKNVGQRAGKDVVQAYLTAPYTKGGIEKSSVNFITAIKTSELKPGDEEVIELPIEASDFASYDCYDKNKNGFKGYELEDGTYQIKLQTDSHNVAKYHDESGKETTSPFEFVVDSGTSEKSILMKTDKYTGKEVKNRFTGADTVDVYPIDGIQTDKNGNVTHNDNIPFISRENFKNPLDKTSKDPAREYSDYLKATQWFTKEQQEAWDSNTGKDSYGNNINNNPVTWGQENGIKLVEGGNATKDTLTLGSDYNDPLWDKALNQIKYETIKKIIGPAYGIGEIKELSKPAASEFDGPAQIRGYAGAPTPRGVGYPSATLVAQTFDKKIGYAYGISYGTDCSTLGVAGVWGFGVDIHRTPVGGRNFEYYSEDPMLSAMIVSNVTRGLGNTGTYSYLKHFAMNDTENHRSYLYNFNTEQALREVYLKPFQKAIQQGENLGLMTTYGRIGATFTGGSEALINCITRNEWGFKGSIISDYAADTNGKRRFMNMDQALRAGSDLGMGVGLNQTQDITKKTFDHGSLVNPWTIDYSDKASNRLQNQIRETAHHILYTWARAKYLNDNYNAEADVENQILPGKYVTGWNWWIPTLWALDVLIAGGLALWLFLDIYDPKWLRKNGKAAPEAVAVEPDKNETNEEQIVSTAPSREQKEYETKTDNTAVKSDEDITKDNN